MRSDGAKRFLVTGGAGFIGSAVVRHLIEKTPHHVAVIDKLTYAGNPASLAAVAGDPRYRFWRADIADGRILRGIIGAVQPDVIMHLAAETHVDRSITGAAEFVGTNIVGTFELLEATLEYWRVLPPGRRNAFRFQHVSTDEVFGALGPTGAFKEETPYRPSSPYSAAKAASDHLVRAWHRTYDLPVVLSNCSNNYGPRQFPEKLVPLMILNGLEGLPLPLYGDGRQVRDWLYVGDHVAALMLVAERGQRGETYLVGGENNVANRDIVAMICSIMDRKRPDAAVGPRSRLIRFVTDRPGHDLRYAVDSTKIRRELGWQPRETLRSGLEKTVDWYLDNEAWWRPLLGEVPIRLTQASA